MTYFPAFIFFGLVVWCVTITFQRETTLKKFFLPALVVKLSAGICLGLVYTYYYTVGDTLVFYEDGYNLAQLCRSDPSSYLDFLFKPDALTVPGIQFNSTDQRTILMVKIASVFCLLSFDNYWIITSYITLISFFASWYLVRQIHLAFPDTTGSAVLAFLFFPSVTFWTSGLIKEAIAMASLYFICGVFVRVWVGWRISIIVSLTTFIAIYLLWGLKYYFAGIFLAVIIATLLHRFLSWRFQNIFHGVRGLVAWFTILLILIGGVTFLHPNFKSHRLLTVMVQNYHEFHRLSKPENVIHFDNLQPTAASMIFNSPKALFAGLFRPIFFDAGNFFSFVMSIENICLLIMSFFALKFVRRLVSPGAGVLLSAIVVYVILLAIFITLSTPNLGTLARYRVGYLPFFVFLILLTPSIAIRLQNIINIRSKAD